MSVGERISYQDVQALFLSQSSANEIVEKAKVIANGKIATARAVVEGVLGLETIFVKRVSLSLALADMLLKKRRTDEALVCLKAIVKEWNESAGSVPGNAAQAQILLDGLKMRAGAWPRVAGEIMALYRSLNSPELAALVPCGPINTRAAKLEVARRRAERDQERKSDLERRIARGNRRSSTAEAVGPR